MSQLESASTLFMFYFLFDKKIFFLLFFYSFELYSEFNLFLDHNSNSEQEKIQRAVGSSSGLTAYRDEIVSQLLFERRRDTRLKVLKDLRVLIEEKYDGGDKIFDSCFKNILEYLESLSGDDHMLGYRISDKEYFGKYEEYLSVPEPLKDSKLLDVLNEENGIKNFKKMLKKLQPDYKVLPFNTAAPSIGNSQSDGRVMVYIPPKKGDLSEKEVWVQFVRRNDSRSSWEWQVSTVTLAHIPGKGKRGFIWDHIRRRNLNSSSYHISTPDHENMIAPQTCHSCHKSSVLLPKPTNDLSKEDKKVWDFFKKRIEEMGPIPLVESPQDSESKVPTVTDMNLTVEDMLKFEGFIDPNSMEGKRQLVSLKKIELAAKSCIDCHDGTNQSKLYPPFILEHHVSKGYMPPDNNLSDEERSKLAAYLESQYYDKDGPLAKFLKEPKKCDLPLKK